MVGMKFGRNQRTGKTWLHAGVKILVRALDHHTGYNLANSICVAIDDFTRGVVVIDDVEHYVQSLYREPLIELGEETLKKRQLFSINARVAMQDVEPSLG
jgi:hypothetical protein